MAKSMEADALSVWLLNEHSVCVNVRICHKWRTTDWSSSPVLMSLTAVEESIGERLRLSQYEDCFVDADAAERLSVVFAEQQPAVAVSGLLLRQWYAKYHPKSGPLKYDTALALEAGMGDELRASYAGMERTVLQNALGKRRKAVLVTERTCRTWIKRMAASDQQLRLLPAIPYRSDALHLQH